jgi:hypothetical protein
MATPPPLIRSSKAFSVEIPEGSNSAKSRRSDVVGSDDLSISAKKTDFKTSDSVLLPEMHHEPVSELADRSAKHADALALQNLNVHEDATSHAAQMAREDSHTDTNIQSVPDDALPDRTVDLPHTDSNRDNLQSIAQGALKDNLQAVSAASALNENLQAVDNAAINDNLQSVENAAINDNLQSVTQNNSGQRNAAVDKAHLKDNIASVSTDALQSNSQGVQMDALTDRTAGEPNSRINDRQSSAAKGAVQDNLQDLPSNALDNNQQALDNPAIHGNQLSLDDDSLQDNQQAVDNPTIEDNTADLPSDRLDKRNAESAKEHAQDHVVALPVQDARLKDVPQPVALNTTGASTTQESYSASGKSSGSGKATAAHSKVMQSAEATKLQAAKLEQARRMDEFHGRVEALKKTVSGINNLLDELEEKKP